MIDSISYILYIIVFLKTYMTNWKIPEALSKIDVVLNDTGKPTLLETESEG